MKQGSLIRLVRPIDKEGCNKGFYSLKGKLWLVLSVTKTKKTWKRFITLYNNNTIITIPWKKLSMFEVINVD